ncbi:MAG: hypothetical protein WCS73_00845 [Lentisphaeria bacterium]
MTLYRHGSSSASVFDRKSARLLIACLIVAVLHAPLLVLRPVDNTILATVLENRKPKVVALRPGTSKSCTFFEKELYRWAEVADCSKNYLLDLKEGYLQFITMSAPRPPVFFPKIKIVPISIPDFVFPQTVVSCTELSLEDSILQNWPLNNTLPFIKDSKVVWENGVFWQLYHKGGLKNPPVLSSEEIKQLQEGLSLSDIKDTTILEVILQPGLSVPRVIIRQTCGVVLLDSAAVRALRKTIEEQLRQLNITNPHTSENSFSLRKSFLFEVDWRFAPQK